MIKEKYNLGIIGAGNISDLHCSAIKKTKLGSLYSVFDIDRKSSEKLKSNFSELVIFDSLEEMIDDDKIDVFVVLIPPKKHFEVIMKLSEKTDKPIFCEKPLVLNEYHLKKVIDLADQGKRIFVGQSYRFFNHIIKAKEYFLKNIDDLRYFEIRFRKHIHKVRPLESWRSRYEDYVIVDNGIHIIDLLSYLTGKKVEKIYCQADNTSGVIDGFDTSFINLELSGGIKGVIILEHNNIISNTLYEGKHYYRFNNKTLTLDETGLIEYIDNTKEAIEKNILIEAPITENWLDSFTRMWNSFFESMRSGKEMEVDPKSVKNSIEGVLMAIKSAREGRISTAGQSYSKNGIYGELIESGKIGSLDKIIDLKEFRIKEIPETDRIRIYLKFILEVANPHNLKVSTLIREFYLLEKALGREYSKKFLTKELSGKRYSSMSSYDHYKVIVFNGLKALGITQKEDTILNKDQLKKLSEIIWH